MYLLNYTFVSSKSNQPAAARRRPTLPLAKTRFCFAYIYNTKHCGDNAINNTLITTRRLSGEAHGASGLPQRRKKGGRRYFSLPLIFICLQIYDILL